MTGNAEEDKGGFIDWEAKWSKKGIEYRNGLVHAGASLPDWKELESILRAVNDVLWVCELYAGAGWAGEYISANTIQLWPKE